jgi:hypothetical protein
MAQKNEIRKVYQRERVTVIIPPQMRFMAVRRIRQAPPEELPQARLAEGFKLIRHVINIDLYDPQGGKQSFETFDPPIEIHVRYTPADQAAAAAHKKPLRLAYFYNNKWVYFTKEKHGFYLQSDPNPENGGEGVVKISRWGDPMIGWGA